jgi:hypothetical protein
MDSALAVIRALRRKRPELVRQKVREPIVVKELFHPLLVRPANGVPVRRRRLPVKQTTERADETESSDTDNSDDSDYTVQESDTTDTDTDIDTEEDATSEDDTAYDSAESGNDAEL